MLEFIQLLNQRYQAVTAHLNTNDARRLLFQQRIEQLFLAEAFIRKRLLLEAKPETPLQIAILGPTQTGKSTLTNLILNSQQAQVSPLSGHTVQAQGFCQQTTIEQCAGLADFYGRLQQVAQNELSSERYDCYSLTESHQQSALLPPCVFWDTPDFDSIGSADYREGVLKTIALADIVVLVVSKEKYADQSVWNLMSALALLHQPSLICINKLASGNEQVLLDSLKEKWQQARADDFPDVIPLYYQKQTGMPVWDATKNKVFFQLQQKVSHQRHRAYEDALLRNYWHSWLEPVVAEQQTIASWQALLEQNITQLAADYQRDFLNHPHHYDTFQHALIQLLSLLEIPGISGVLTKTRRVLTWPLRKIIGIGRKPKSELSQEATVLAQLGEHLLLTLTDQLLTKIDTDTEQAQWWTDCYGLLRQQHDKLLLDYQHAVADYRKNFQQDVELAANKLYQKLARNPATLNSLRAVRASVDVGAIASIIATAGVGIHDLVVTPAMLSITSILTESAVARYMQGVEAELKKHQLDTVSNDLFNACLKQSLALFPEQLPKLGRFNIAPEQTPKNSQQDTTT